MFFHVCRTLENVCISVWLDVFCLTLSGFNSRRLQNDNLQPMIVHFLLFVGPKLRYKLYLVVQLCAHKV